mgnify:CR=1 FL=1
MRISNILLMVIFPTAALAEWETNMPRGVTPTSEVAYDLHMLIFYITVVIGIVVFGAMLYSILYHRKSLGHKPAKFHESTKVEIIWTVIPFIILVGMAVPATKALIMMEDTRDSEITLKVTGYQWMWQYEYLEDNVTFFSKISDESNTALVTERVAKTFLSAIKPERNYLRKSFVHTGSFVSNLSAKFVATTASAPTGMTATTENDFMFFINGMVMENDALTITQNSSTDLRLTINSSELGYSLESDDEVIGFGKFNS